jgi:murein tripeptide amidase MpaA
MIDIDNPRSAEFWWENHTRLVREGKMKEPFRRNPEDIRTALHFEDEALPVILEAHQRAMRYYNIRQSQSGAETFAYTLIARLLDQGVLVRPERSNDENT